GEHCVAPAPGPILRVGISVGRVFRRAPRPPTLRRAKAAVKENSESGRDNQNVRMVGTGPGPSEHSSGTGGREDARTTQKRPSRLARPARLERATLRFEA